MLTSTWRTEVSDNCRRKVRAKGSRKMRREAHAHGKVRGYSLPDYGKGQDDLARAVMASIARDMLAVVDKL